MEFTKEQKRCLRQLEKMEKDMLSVGFINPNTDNRQPLPELVQAAWQAYDEDEYWRLWTIFYLRIQWLVLTQNALRKVLDIMDAPLYLEQEMKNHNYLHKFN